MAQVISQGALLMIINRSNMVLYQGAFTLVNRK